MVAKSAAGAARYVVLYDRLVCALGRLRGEMPWHVEQRERIGARWWAWYYRECGY
jgi:hypothetical protein